MVRRFDFGQINLTASADDSPTVPRPDTPFCIAILSDLSGRSIPRQSFQDIANRRAVQVDRDSFSEVLAKFGPRLSLPIGENAGLALRFSDLDDFHPDRLYTRAEMFRRLREVRQRLQDPATLVAASDELGVRLESQAAAKMSAPPESAGVVASGLTPGGLLDEIVEHAEGRERGGSPSRVPDGLRDFVRRVTETHLVAATDPRQAELIGVIDRALSAQMRALLHVPAFQELEAAWRAIYFLVRRIETGPQLKIYLFDISKEELAADLGTAQDWHASGAFRLLNITS